MNRTDVVKTNSPDVVVITGGAGFIGSALIRYLINSTSSQIVNIDKLTYAGNLSTLDSVSTNSRYNFVQIDINDRPAVRAVLERFRPDALIHLAAESHVDRSLDGPQPFIETNIVGTFALLEESLRFWRSLDQAAQNRFRFHHVSTDEVYGTLGAKGLFTEQSAYAPNSPYSASKAASDHLVRAWNHSFGMPVVTSNCSNNYGPYQYPEKLIPLMILNALDGKPLPIYGKGENIRDWLFVSDHAEALWLVLRHGRPGETYNIGGHNERTNLSVVETICRTLEELRPSTKTPRYADLIEFVTDRPAHDLRYAIDASKLERELGWRPRESFESGLRKTIEWYLANLDWCRQLPQVKDARTRRGLEAVQ